MNFDLSNVHGARTIEVDVYFPCQPAACVLVGRAGRRVPCISDSIKRMSNIKHRYTII
jgi:hypothetical protein